MIKQLLRGFIFLSIILCAQLAIAKPQPLDSIVAVVNDVVITQSELDKALHAVQNQMISANTSTPADALHHQVIEELIDRKLQLQAAEQAGIKISDSEIDQAIEEIAHNNGMSSAADLYQKITSQGLSKAEYRKEINEELKLQRIEQQEVASKISLNAEDIKNAARATASPATATIKEYQLEDLIVLLPEAASAAQIASAKKQADALLAQIRSGVSYEAITAAEANHHSVEKADLGWRTLAEVPSAFASQVSTMKKNSVLGPIQTANGFHLLRLIAVRTPANQATAAPTPTAKQAEQLAYERKFEVAIKKWVAKLRSQAVINMHPNS